MSGNFSDVRFLLAGVRGAARIAGDRLETRSGASREKLRPPDLPSRLPLAGSALTTPGNTGCPPSDVPADVLHKILTPGQGSQTEGEPISLAPGVLRMWGC